ncbi:MAG: caspase family protein [Scytonema sp. PMC 1069.18]|nr:caspase family protein [Scytonema sp. PMC 1069.18]MEC4886066.1 caspase family protein [Scytonema sp. PMC 1070.18]
MTKSIYALLVGIDRYHPESKISALEGCVNDIKAAEAYLQERIAKDKEWQLIEPWILTNEQATRQAIINGFENHLSKAGSDDVVLFYYAGHGAQEKTPEIFWHLEPDGLNESLVCYDSRTAGGTDLADKELAYLISKVAQKNPHVLIILDCCHSGSGTRDLSPEIKVRRASVDYRERTLNSYVFAQDKTGLDKLLTSSLDLEKQTTGVLLPKGKHIMFSACRDYELAKEYKGDDGQPRGVFSYFLLQTLQRTNGNITYRDLARNINALVVSKVKEQSPQVEATDPKELDQPFLGGAIGESTTYFTLTHSKNDDSWVIDGGGLHGISSSHEGETRLAIFPITSKNEELSNLDSALGEAKVTQVMPQSSKVKIVQAKESLSDNESYKAVIISVPFPCLRIYLKSDENEALGIELAQKALQSSSYVSQVNQVTDADYYLIARNNQYWIVHLEDLHPVVAPIPERPNHTGYTPERASQLRIRLEHIARWKNILQLSTPATSSIKQSDVEMEIIVSGRPNSSGSEIRVNCISEDGKDEYVNIQVRLINNSRKTLYVNVILLAENFAVELPFFNQKTSIRLAPQGSLEATIVSEEPLFGIPEEFVEQGVTEYKDIFKLIASTTEFNAALLQQDGFTPPPLTRSLEEYEGTLNRLFTGVSTRNAIKVKGTYDDWITKEVPVIFVRQQDTRAIQLNSSIPLLNSLVEV